MKCAGSACILGGVTGNGCAGNGPCPLDVLEERGVIARRPIAKKGLDIPFDQWAEHSGSYVIDSYGSYWQILGFIDRPAVIIELVSATRRRETIIMGSEQSRGYDVLAPKATP